NSVGNFRICSVALFATGSSGLWIGKPVFGAVTILPALRIISSACTHRLHAWQYAASAARSLFVWSRSGSSCLTVRRLSRLACASRCAGQGGAFGFAFGSFAGKGRRPGLPFSSRSVVGGGLRPLIVHHLAARVPPYYTGRICNGFRPRPESWKFRGLLPCLPP